MDLGNMFKQEREKSKNRRGKEWCWPCGGSPLLLPTTGRGREQGVPVTPCLPWVTQGESGQESRAREIGFTSN